MGANGGGGGMGKGAIGGGGRGGSGKGERVLRGNTIRVIDIWLKLLTTLFYKYDCTTPTRYSTGFSFISNLTLFIAQLI